MTLEEVNALIAAIDVKPKRCQFAYHNPRVDLGRGVVKIKTTASPESLRRWFRDAGAMVTHIEVAGKLTYYTCWFDWM